MLSVVLLAASASAVQINVDWTSSIRTLKTTPAFQTVVNSLTTSVAPQSEAIWQSVQQLGSQYQRYVPWLPYPKLGVAAMEPPSGDALCGFVNSGGAGNPWTATLDCAGQGVIDNITFASYGNPSGYCGSLTAGSCSSPQSMSVVKSACLGKSSCTVASSDETFGGNPCAGTATSLAIQVTCSNTTRGFTYWNFTWPDDSTVPFLKAASNRSIILNYSTPPQWLYAGPREKYPDDPLAVTWSYEQGTQLNDPTMQAFGEYYGRLVAHYVEGGFYDEYGTWVPGYTLNDFGAGNTTLLYEVLNEIEGEHHDSPATYTAIYDAVVAGIRKFAPTGSANMKFVGLALESDADFGYATYFLNASNHKAGIPIDLMSFHFYAECSSRDGGVNGSDYEQFFPQADNFFKNAQTFANIRDALNPSVLIDADELGVILPDDNDAKWTSENVGFPLIYWNAAAALYAYEYGTLSATVGLDIVGMSQLVGYPAMNFTRTDTGESMFVLNQYPSVAMLNWTDGTGTARYWALKLIIDNVQPFVDTVYNTTVVSGTPSNPFCGSVLNLDTLVLECADAGSTITDILFANYGTPTGSCGTWQVNPACSAANSTAIIKAACLGQASCSIDANTATFGDPCYGTVKTLNVQAKCSGAHGGFSPSASAPVFAQAYGNGTNKKLLLVNKSSSPQAITLPADFAGATWYSVDESTGFGPASQSVVPSGGSVTLAPFAVAFAVGNF